MSTCRSSLAGGLTSRSNAGPAAPQPRRAEDARLLHLRTVPSGSRCLSILQSERRRTAVALTGALEVTLRYYQHLTDEAPPDTKESAGLGVLDESSSSMELHLGYDAIMVDSLTGSAARVGDVTRHSRRFPARGSSDARGSAGSVRSTTRTPGGRPVGPRGPVAGRPKHPLEGPPTRASRHGAGPAAQRRNT